MGGSYDRKAGLQGSVPDHDAGVGAGDPQFGNIEQGTAKIMLDLIKAQQTAEELILEQDAGGEEP